MVVHESLCDGLQAMGRTDFLGRGIWFNGRDQWILNVRAGDSAQAQTAGRTRVAIRQTIQTSSDEQANNQNRGWTVLSTLVICG